MIVSHPKCAKDQNGLFTQEKMKMVNKCLNNYLLSKDEKDANQNMRSFFIHQIRQMWFERKIIFNE